MFRTHLSPVSESILQDQGLVMSFQKIETNSLETELGIYFFLCHIRGPGKPENPLECAVALLDYVSLFGYEPVNQFLNSGQGLVPDCLEHDAVFVFTFENVAVVLGRITLVSVNGLCLYADYNLSELIHF